ncbi:hypothetical protein FACS18949_15220 [Clostridia bacterium]|nr:hypothetical protein FACS189425_10520 [Clostridia bacterium]GHV36159.1 hypothetical protein FACS18949_15220 [Clostridia bacterium]
MIPRESLDLYTGNIVFGDGKPVLIKSSTYSGIGKMYRLFMVGKSIYIETSDKALHLPLDGYGKLWTATQI